MKKIPKVISTLCCLKVTNLGKAEKCINPEKIAKIPRTLLQRTWSFVKGSLWVLEAERHEDTVLLAIIARGSERLRRRRGR